jgi:hypothetical protein
MSIHAHTLVPAASRASREKHGIALRVHAGYGSLGSGSAKLRLKTPIKVLHTRPRLSSSLMGHMDSSQFADKCVGAPHGDRSLRTGTQSTYQGSDWMVCWWWRLGCRLNLHEFNRRH